MGIRVDKRIGYGLKDLRTRKAKKHESGSVVVDDPRWDYAKFEAEWLEGDKRGHTMADYLEWCVANRERLDALAIEEGWTSRSLVGTMIMSLRDRVQRKDYWHWSPGSAPYWDYEGGQKNVLHFMAPERAHEWLRHDNIIDYYEEQTLRDGPRVRATMLKGRVGIWPHDGFAKRCRLPSRDVSNKLTAATEILNSVVSRGGDEDDVDGAAISRMNAQAYNMLVGDYAPGRVNAFVKDPEVLRHFREDWRPLLPVGVLAVIEYLGCFPDAFGPDGVANALRPMIYVTWG